MWVGLSSKKSINVKEDIPLNSNTNTGKIIELIENKLPNFSFYKTNIVKCLPLDKNKKLRYPTIEEMSKCIPNLLYEIETINPKIIFLLGKKTYNFFITYLKQNNIKINSNYFYIEHPSYIYIYKRKYIDEYIFKVINIIKENII